MSESPDSRTPPDDPAAAMRRLKALPATDRARILELLTAKTYAEARPDVEKIVGCECPVSTLSRFFRWQSRENHIEEANDLVQQLDERIPDAGRRRTICGIVDAGLDSLVAEGSAHGESRTLVATVKLQLAREQQTLRRERLELAKRNARRADKYLKLQREKLHLVKHDAIALGIDALSQEFKMRPDLYRKFEPLVEELTGRRVRPLTRQEEIEQEEQRHPTLANAPKIAPEL